MSEQLTMSMVERVARAIWEGDPYPGDRCAWDELPAMNAEAGDVQGLYRTLARAAIEAMRECDLVYRNEEGQVVHELRGPPNVIWKVMIDAVLDPLANPLATAPDEE